MFPQCISTDRQFLYRLSVLMADIFSNCRNILTILGGRCADNELQIKYQIKEMSCYYFDTIFFFLCFADRAPQYNLSN